MSISKDGHNAKLQTADDPLTIHAIGDRDAVGLARNMKDTENAATGEMQSLKSGC